MKIALQILGLLFFGCLSIWDITTTVLGVASASGTVKVVAGNLLQIFIDLFGKMSTPNIMALVIAVGITGFDVFFHQELKNRHKNKHRFYTVALLFGLCKTYDVWTTFLGTARTMLPALNNYDKPDLIEVFSTISNGIELFTIIFFTVLVSVSATILIMIIEDMQSNP